VLVALARRHVGDDEVGLDPVDADEFGMVGHEAAAEVLEGDRVERAVCALGGEHVQVIEVRLQVQAGALAHHARVEPDFALQRQAGGPLRQAEVHGEDAEQGQAPEGGTQPHRQGLGGTPPFHVRNFHGCGVPGGANSRARQGLWLRDATSAIPRSPETITNALQIETYFIFI
jgi:hypothetical protein